MYWGLEEEKGKLVKKVDVPFENNDDSEWNSVETSANRIYYYSSVNRPKILKLNKSLVHLSTTIQAREMQYQSESKTPIRLHINSYGGSVFAGLAAVDYIKKSKVPVETVIDGCAASAATLMSVVGTKRLMHENACMLVHQLSGHMWGKFQEMKDDMINSEMLMKKIKNIYRQHTKIPEEKLEEILNHDLWWDAEQCLEYGMVDEVI
jgi:ATP-dependent Clp endopeptidase proteolytic subunit ClpP